MSNAHDYITYVADRTASREVDALTDYYGIGALIRDREVTYKRATTLLVEAFEARGLKASTAKVYLSQGAVLAKFFATFEDLEDFADAECDGSRSLKRLYDAVRKPAKPKPATALVDVVLAGLANLTDAGDIARVRDAAAAMLTPVEVTDAA